MQIILASQSAARQNMLRNAGLDFKTVPSAVDEDAFKQQGLAPGELAAVLAKAKALDVAKHHPGAYVIGADQILVLGDTVLSKAHNAEEARAKLKMLRGRTHTLLSAVSVVQDTRVLWSYTAQADLHMHDVDDAFLDRYIEVAGDALIKSVGAYALEEQGAWLFESIDGDYFTILGMPLLPLLTYLREQGLTP